MNQLEQLRRLTTVVADTGDFQGLRAFAPQDATTNPSLILKAAQKPEYLPLLQQIVTQHKNQKPEVILDHLLVAFGCEILKIIPGRVSTEIDARLSFDTEASIRKAHTLIALYEAAGIDRNRILIKIASTWEGIRAAQVLEHAGIHCNLTLLFCLPQAIACAEAGVTLISPFVGRITDWYKKVQGTDFTAENDPGVRSVKQVYAYLRKYGFATEIMGASFRNVGQILALAGCDLLTISPDLLQKLADCNDAVTRQLSAEGALQSDIAKLDIDESRFRFLLNENAMACDKLAEGIRAFCADTIKLEQLIAAQQS